MKKNKLFWILTVVCVLNFAAHLYFYPSLPDIVPTHWGASGQVNGWGPSWTATALGALPLGMLVLFCVIPLIDPKGNGYARAGKFYQRFVVVFTLLMIAVSWLPELTIWGVIAAKLHERHRLRADWRAARWHRQLYAPHRPELHHGSEDPLGAQ